MFGGGGDGGEQKPFHLFTHLGFWHSSWPWYDMQTTMFSQRSVITLIEWRWQVASGLPVDRNPMLGCSALPPPLSLSLILTLTLTYSQSKLSTQDYLPLNCHLRPSASVRMIDTEHILFTLGGREVLKAARPTKGNRSLIMRGKWKSLQEWLILTDRGRSKRRITFRNKRGITKTLQRRRKNHCTHK